MTRTASFATRSVLLRRSLTPIALAASLALTMAAAPHDSSASPTTSPALVTAAPFKLVYSPSVGESERWYINDHTFVRDDAGTWHMIGITHAEPANPLDEKHLAHATAKSLMGPWTKQPFALDVDEKAGEVILWAPHIVRHEGVYYMFYCAGDRDPTKYKIHLATSPDLKTWTRSSANPMVVDGFDARDPMIIRVGAKWVMYYTGNSTPAGGDHVVFAVTSGDLVHWGDKCTVFTSPRRGKGGGPTESPFVVQRGDTYYLFCGAWEGYSDTHVFRSSDPFKFELADRVGRIPSHALEVIRDADGAWYATHSGWGEGGVHLATMTWHDGKDDGDTTLPPPKPVEKSQEAKQ